MKIFFAILIVLVVVGGGIYFWNARPERGDEHREEKSMMEEDSAGKDSVMMQDDAVDETMEKDSTTIIDSSGTVLAGTQAKLIDFNKADYEKAIASDKLVVLYFYANWCPICRAEFPIMQEVFGGLETSNVVGFRVNYNDNETDADEKALARQFGVAYQHTKVFVKNGEQILKAPDTWTKARYESEIHATL